MNGIISKAALEARRARYPVGCRVALVRTSDPYTTLVPGELGTVDFLDSIGTIFVNWDNGSTLGMAFGEDYVVRVDMRSDT